MLFGFTGRKGVGKDTIAEAMRRDGRFGAVHFVAFAEDLKKTVGALFTLSHAQLHDPAEKERVDERYGVTPRVLMQRFGTDLMRKGVIHAVFPEMKGYSEPGVFWIDSTKRKIALLRDADDNAMILVTDVRFPDEVGMVESQGGVVLHITRGDSESVEPEHMSEALRPNPSWHHIANDGTVEEAVEKIYQFYVRLSA